MTAAIGRIGPSESQSKAVALRASPYRDVAWSSKDERRRRRSEPPTGIDALVSWFRREWELELPEALHERGVWAEHVGAGARAAGVQAVGGSLIGSPAYAGAFRRRLEESPHQAIDGELERPLLSALAALRGSRRHGHDTIVALVYMAHFDWRAIAGVPFYRRRTSGGRLLIRMMDEPVVRDVLEHALEALWFLFLEREPIAGDPP